MAYLLDANVFMAAENLHYGMDFCPAFWDWLIQANQAGKVFSIERVCDEIKAGNDALVQWASERGDGFFLKLDAAALTGLGKVAAWVNDHAIYSPAAKNTFLQIADYYLVAHALAGRHFVVTHEKPENSVHRVKIPNVCLGVGVEYLSPFDMLRRERARFVLRLQAV
jgi:hypothetical protein